VKSPSPTSDLGKCQGGGRGRAGNRKKRKNKKRGFSQLLVEKGTASQSEQQYLWEGNKKNKRKKLARRGDKNGGEKKKVRTVRWTRVEERKKDGESRDGPERTLED